MQLKTIDWKLFGAFDILTSIFDLEMVAKQRQHAGLCSARTQFNLEGEGHTHNILFHVCPVLSLKKEKVEK